MLGKLTTYIMEVARQASIRIQAYLPSIIRTMKADRRSPMRVYDVAGESAVYYSHHDSVHFNASACMIQYVKF
jgi:hypothetical protein